MNDGFYSNSFNMMKVMQVFACCEDCNFYGGKFFGNNGDAVNAKFIEEFIGENNPKNIDFAKKVNDFVKINCGGWTDGAFSPNQFFEAFTGVTEDVGNNDVDEVTEVAHSGEE